MKGWKWIGLVAGGILLASPLGVWAEETPAAGSETTVASEEATAGPAQAEEQEPLRNQWEYQAEGNIWHYYGFDGQPVTGRRQIDGDTYFFDSEGKMLTGWVESGDRDGDDAEAYHAGGVDDTVYYCDTTGRMSRNQWMPSYAPDSPYYDTFSGPTEDADEPVNWYYFDAKGHAYRNKKLTYEGDDFYFDENGARLAGWVYEDNRDGETKYVKVTDETEEAQSGDIHGDGTYDEGFYAHNPQNYIFCDYDSGKAVKNAWIDAIPPGKGDEEDNRSYYCGKNGRIVTQYRYGFLRDTGDWDHHPDEINDAIVADKVYPCKVEDENLGTYAFNGAPGSNHDDEGFEGFIFKAADDRYYLCENNGARQDGLFLIRKKEESSLRKFPNGFYDFSDNNAMATGERLKKAEDGNEVYYYRFADKTEGDDYRGRGVTGVYGGRLYYQGLAVGSESTERYELVYIPEIADRDAEATGLFLVDSEGKVKTGKAQKVNSKGIRSGGTKYRDYGSLIYRVCKPEHGNGKNGWDIYWIDKDDVDDEEDEALKNEKEFGTRLGADDAAYIYLKEAEE